MNQNSLTFKVFACVTLVFAFSGTEALAHKREQTREAYRAELESLMNENKVACKIASDCNALPVGSRSCGGPTEYVLISKGTQAKIQSAATDLIKTIDELDRARNASSGLAGTCDVMEKPAVTCQAGACVKDTAKKN